MKYLSIGFFLALTACNVPEPVENAIESLKRLVGMDIQVKATATPAPAVAASATPSGNANSEILAEIIQVTFNEKEISDPSSFTSLVSSLNQGASLEGVYHGLVMGSRYRVLESKAKAASPNAIKFFSQEMAALQVSMKNPSEFSKETAKLAPSIDYPEGVSDNGPDSLSFGDEKDVPQISEKRSEKEIADTLLQDFIGATPFTLKRVLGDEVLKKMDELKDSSGDIGQWYAAFVLRMADANTDFGLAQRNSRDFDFHFRFAKTMSLDRVKWEVLNRYHRVINRLE